MNWYGNVAPREWDPAVTESLTAAYTDALARANAAGLKVAADGVPIAEAVARFIIGQAKRGIYDVRVLADGAMDYVQRRAD